MTSALGPPPTRRPAVAPPRPEPADAGTTRPAVRLGVAAFLVVLVCSLGGIQLLPPSYAATAVVSFSPRPTAMSTAETVQLVCQKYVVIATSGQTMHAASAMVGLSPEELSTSTTVTLEAGTANVDITVERPDRDAAVAAANAIAEVLVRDAADDPLVTGETTSPALSSRVTTKPARSVLRAAAVIAALLVGVWVLTIRRGRPARSSLVTGAGDP
jgi:capsular polysaccharide biosynthesis protein